MFFVEGKKEMKNRLKKLILENNILYFFVGHIVFRKFNFFKN